MLVFLEVCQRVPQRAKPVRAHTHTHLTHAHTRLPSTYTHTHTHDTFPLEDNEALGLTWGQTNESKIYSHTIVFTIITDALINAYSGFVWGGRWDVRVGKGREGKGREGKGRWGLGVVARYILVFSLYWYRKIRNTLFPARTPVPPASLTPPPGLCVLWVRPWVRPVTQGKSGL